MIGALEGSAEVDIVGGGVVAARGSPAKSPENSRKSPEKIGESFGWGGENGSDAVKISKR